MNFTANTLQNLRAAGSTIGAARLDPVDGRPDRWIIKIQRNGGLAVACDADTGMAALFATEGAALAAVAKTTGRPS